MKPPTDYEVFEKASAEHRRLLEREGLFLEVTEALAGAMERENITKAQLARRLKKTKSFVSQLFGGGRNLTLGTIADIAHAIGYRVIVGAVPREPEESWLAAAFTGQFASSPWEGPIQNEWSAYLPKIAESPQGYDEPFEDLGKEVAA
jgi:transcriptional regulator with XRE-family HTH domain